MKRVNARIGFKQRMNDVLGTDIEDDADGIPGITEWSIQAAMIANTKRIVSALVGGTIGRPVKGLWLSEAPGTGIDYSISAGYGFTPGGDIVVFNTAVTHFISDTSDGDKHLYVKHKMGAVDGDTYDDGRKTGFIGRAGLEDIVYDDFAASKKDTVSGFSDELIEEFSSPVSNDAYVYLGYITMSGGTIDSITNNPNRGFGPNDDTGKYLLPGINVTGESIFNQPVTFTEVVTLSSALADLEVTGLSTLNNVDITGDIDIDVGASLTVSGQAGIDAGVIVRDEAGTGTKTLYFKKGVLYLVDTP